jgi:ABC-type Zn uptake system ZnuABC Zn-binding protein ZnuA
MNLRTVGLICCLSLFSICGCSRAPDPFGQVKEGQLRILTSFPPLYCFAANVAGEQAKVLCFLTVEGPHDYQFAPLDSIKTAKADLFLVNGLELDDFVTKVTTRRSIIFKVGEKIPDDKLIHLDESERKHVHADGSECTHGEHDPHVWLGPEHAQLMVHAIAGKLAELQPEHKAAFDERAQAYAKELRGLHAYGLEKFKGKSNRRIILTHDFLRYFAEAFDLEVVGSIQPKPGQEADAGQLARLCREKDVHVIVIEPQYSKGSAETLQREFAAKGVYVRIVEVDPMETATADEHGNPPADLYLKRMRENIDNLARALP